VDIVKVEELLGGVLGIVALDIHAMGLVNAMAVSFSGRPLDQL